MTLFEALRSELDGYKPQAPSRLTARDDARMIATLHCSACGQRGLEYRPFSKRGSYRIFAVCRHCAASEEL